LLSEKRRLMQSITMPTGRASGRILKAIGFLVILIATIIGSKIVEEKIEVHMGRLVHGPPRP
jgi:hypothetical protein